MSGVVTENSEVLGGDLVFAGTRVPAKSLFDHLKAGESIEQFLNGFPSVKREQVIALLEEARRQVTSPHRSEKRTKFPIFSSRSPGTLDLTPQELA
ncbi:MAG TPA: DUF433 domain-containing protein, partial [Chthoniobacterales bacterium]|nr:DUF433 domain-containing protein [Chthoniobacterales bacterium]